MSLMDIELTANGAEYDVPGIGPVPRLSSLLGLLDHPTKRARIEAWKLKAAMRGAVQLLWHHMDVLDIEETDWATEPISDANVDDALALGGGTWQADQGSESHQIMQDAVNGVLGFGIGIRPAESAALDELIRLGLFDAVAHVERPAYIPALHCAGTPDLILVHGDDSVTVVDYKTGSADWLRWQRQLVAYAWPWSERGYRVRDLVVIRMGVGPEARIPEGTIEVRSVNPPTGDYLTRAYTALLSAAETFRIAIATGTARENGI